VAFIGFIGMLGTIVIGSVALLYKIYHKQLAPVFGLPGTLLMVAAINIGLIVFSFIIPRYIKKLKGYYLDIKKNIKFIESKIYISNKLSDENFWKRLAKQLRRIARINSCEIGENLPSSLHEALQKVQKIDKDSEAVSVLIQKVEPMSSSDNHSDMVEKAQ